MDSHTCVENRLTCSYGIMQINSAYFLKNYLLFLALMYFVNKSK